MILTMAYLFLIAVLICVAAIPGERLCAELGWPRRSAWLVALVASIALPAYAMFFTATDTAGSPILSLPLAFDVLPPVDDVAIDTVNTGAAAAASFSWPDWRAFDSAFVAVWIASSGLMLIFCLLASLRLRHALRHSQSLAIGNQQVLLSDSLGPAVLGVLSPTIVLPRWLGENESTLRSLVLSHEREHIAARDHMLLFAALLLVTLMPWNIALWWQLRRLRIAMEVDCDGRVLKIGTDAHDYSEALLTVGQRSTRTPFASVALTEPVSELEKRISIMMQKARRFSVTAFGTRSVLVIAALGLAVAVNAPNAQQAAGTGTAGGIAADERKVIPTIRTVVYDRLNEAQICLDAEDAACAMEILDEVEERRDLSVYETAQLHNFRAFVHFERDEHEQAAKAYENILALPRSDMPDGLIKASMRNLATLHLQEERYEDGLNLFENWMELPTVTPGPDDHYLKATILYQLERYQDALVPMEQAIADAEEPTEQQYQLLYVLNFQTDNQEGVMSALETLNARWPSDTWARTLEGARVRANPPETAPSPGPAGVGISSGDYLPISRVTPIYPPPAATRGLEGHVIVRYTVATDGTTKDIEIVESSDPIFENASIESVEKYLYRPRIIDGTPVEVPGVTTRIIFELEEDTE